MRGKLNVQNFIKIIIGIILIAVVIFGVVNVYYINLSKLTIIGESEITVGRYSVYKDKGAKALNNNKDVSKDIKTEGRVDTNIPGNYLITYRYHKKSAVRKVRVLDKMSPALNIKGSDDITLKLGENYNEEGYSAKDDDGNSLTKDVQVSIPDLKRVGVYNITYTLTDKKGNTTKRIRKVRVIQNTDYKTNGLSICMYHYVYNKNNVPANMNSANRGNFIEVNDLRDEMKYLKDNDYYFPTWKEVKEYSEGRLLLPEKNIVITFDDAAQSFLDNGIPILNELKIPATSFIITSHDGKKKVRNYKSEYITFQSHSHDMHRSGGTIGHGGIMTALTEEDIIRDLKTSFKICGHSDAFAYPFGDYSESCENALRNAGVLCAVTTNYGKVYPGDDPLLLNRVRMNYGQSLENFINKIK